MIKNKYDVIMKQYENYYHELYGQTVDWWPSGRTCITIKMSDGMLFEFNAVNNTIRRVRDNDSVTDAETIKKEVGRNIQKVILTRSISQSEIASRCGITEAMLSRYLHGTSMPGLDKLYALASVLGCSINELIGDNKYE
jgi:ribosome-binding protein aMBF1 (putative translation factor)